jgi:uncharacterized cupredoxin-like copper-binding protein
MHRRELRLLTAAAATAVVLGVVSTLGLAAASGAFHNPALPGASFSGARCAAPALSGAVVNVTLADMGAMMRGPYQPGADPQQRRHMEMMRIVAAPGEVPRGTVSMLVVNTGVRPHELVVLPLGAGQGVGQRPVGADGKINEAGSLGEASRTCGAGSGDGIAAGAAGWTTLTLGSGRYELVCNLPGHYTSGMYAELDVTS